MTEPLDYGAFDALTFDCYGTLIDWEAGILAGIQPVLRARDVAMDDETLLVRYAATEAELEAGPYRRYREILGRALREVAAGLGVEATDAEAAAFGGSVADWPAFPDSSAALARLAPRYRLGVLTNCDEDLFAASARRLGIAFDPVVTAEAVRSYKPNEAHFHEGLRRLAADGVPRERVLHVAQSLFHDHAVAGRLGLRSVWIDRRHDRPGDGATPPADAHPDAAFPSMAAFAAAAVPG